MIFLKNTVASSVFCGDEPGSSMKLEKTPMRFVVSHICRTERGRYGAPGTRLMGILQG
jgi:hypothetical protein